MAGDARITQYTVDAPEGWEHESINIVRTGKTTDGKFDPAADVWAIRRGGHSVLNHDGEWEPEPLPSSRDEAFFTRCRWTLAEALEAASNAMDVANERREAWLRDRDQT